MTKKGLHRSLRIYFSKLKKVPTLHLPGHRNTTGAATSRLLSACKYPKTPSFAVDRHHPDAGGATAATLADVDRFLFENFHSLYARGDDEDAGDSNEFSSGSPRYDDEFPTIPSSERFFVSPGTSNSLVEEARLSATSSSSSSGPSEGGPVVPGGGVAVMTFSKDPYDDFRRSMQDMVDARHVDPRRPLDWDFMEELLFCYLELNDRSVHKYILRAFTDLTVSFRRRFPEGRRRVPATKGRRRRRRAREGEVR